MSKVFIGTCFMFVLSLIYAEYQGISSNTAIIDVLANAYAFIANYNSNNLSLCPLNNTDLTTCITSTLPEANGIVDIVVNDAGNKVYVAAKNNRKVL